MTVNSSTLQAVEWCNPSTSCYGFCRSIAIITSGDGRQRSGMRREGQIGYAANTSLVEDSEAQGSMDAVNGIFGL